MTNPSEFLIPTPARELEAMGRHTTAFCVDPEDKVPKAAVYIANVL